MRETMHEYDHLLEPPSWLVRRNLTAQQWRAIGRAIETTAKIISGVLFFGMITGFFAMHLMPMGLSFVETIGVSGGSFFLVGGIVLVVRWIVRLVELAETKDRNGDDEPAKVSRP